MKKLLGAVLGMLMLTLLVTGESRAETVSVSSSAVAGTYTTIVNSNPSRANLCIQNAGTSPIYFSKYSSSATVNAGMVLSTGTAVGILPSPVCINNFTGALYGFAGATATGVVKYFEALR